MNSNIFDVLIQLFSNKIVLASHKFLFDFISDMNLKKQSNWQILILTRKYKELSNILQEHNFKFLKDELAFYKGQTGVFIAEVASHSELIAGVQDVQQKILILSDKDIPGLDEKQKKVKNNHQVYLDLLTSLKVDDLVVHSEHGIGRLNKARLLQSSDKIKIETMKAIKSAIDPNGIFNPGALIDL